jgi:Flp pilus assembly protein TadG
MNINLIGTAFRYLTIAPAFAQAAGPNHAPGRQGYFTATMRCAWTRRQIDLFASSRRGAAVVEFAILAPVLVLLLFGTIASSGAFLTWGMMQGSSAYGARVMSTGTIKNNSAGAITTANTTATTTCTGSLPATEVESYACSNLPSWATFTVTTTENCVVPSVTVSLSTTASAAAIVDVLRLFTGKTLTATAVVMKEGTCP